MNVIGYTVLVLGVIALAMSVLLLAMELQAVKRAQNASISLQIYQQFHNPLLQEALTQIRRLDTLIYHQESLNGNGHHPAKQLTSHENTQLFDEVTGYFGQVGKLMRGHSANGEEIFAMMGPTISEVWHALRPIRAKAEAQNQFGRYADFEWLYTEWLNWDYSRRKNWTTIAIPTPDEQTLANAHVN